MKQYLFTLMLFLFVDLAFAGANQFPSMVDTSRAAIILQQTRARYVGLKNYIDSGIVQLHVDEGKHPGHSSYFFKRTYQKAGLFIFEYYDAGKANLLYTRIRASDGSVKTWWGDDNQMALHKKMVRVINDSMYVFPDKTVLIPGLLLKEFGGNDDIINIIRQPQLVGSELVDKQDCYKISGSQGRNCKITIWVQKCNLLIVKIATDQSRSEFTAMREGYRETRTYRIYAETPGKIDPAVFAFRPYWYADNLAEFRHRLIYSHFGALTGLMLLSGIVYLIRKRYSRRPIT